MKPILILCLCFLVQSSARAQGTILFSNFLRAGGIDAPIFDQGTPVSGPEFLARLYGGPTQTALEPVGAPVPFLSAPEAAGYWTPVVRTIPSVLPGDLAVVQVRVWEAAHGSTFEEASMVPTAKRGSSSMLELTTGGDTKGGTEPPSTPAFMTGLESWFVVIPEPATLWLAAAGWAALALAWRRIR